MSKTARTAAKPNIYQIVTDRIIHSLETGVIPWEKPWKTPHFHGGPFPRNFRTGKPYRGVNVLLLWSSPYSSPFWLTFKQALDLKGSVRKGEKGSLVVYADRFTKTATDAKGADVEIEIPFMKGYTVFNAEQIDGLPGHFYASADASNNDNTRLDTVERFLLNTGAAIKHGGSRAFYSPSLDIVHMASVHYRDTDIRHGMKYRGIPLFASLWTKSVT